MLCCGYTHGLVITVKSIEWYKISMPCGPGVTSHFITSAAKHNCAPFQVLQCYAHKRKRSIQISGTHQLYKLITVGWMFECVVISHLTLQRFYTFRYQVPPFDKFDDPTLPLPRELALDCCPLISLVWRTRHRWCTYILQCAAEMQHTTFNTLMYSVSLLSPSLFPHDQLRHHHQFETSQLMSSLTWLKVRSLPTCLGLDQKNHMGRSTTTRLSWAHPIATLWAWLAQWHWMSR